MVQAWLEDLDLLTSADGKEQALEQVVCRF